MVVTMSTAESQRARHRARATASSHSVVDRLRQSATTLQSQVIEEKTAKKQVQAMYVRLFSVFGRCSLHVTEDPLVSCEVRVVHTASMGAIACQTAVNFLLECLNIESISSVSSSIGETIAPSLPPTTGKISTRSRASSKSTPVETTPVTVNTTAIKLAKVIENARTQLLNKVLILLRATCLSWQCVGAVFVNSDGQHNKNSLHVDVTNIMIALNNLHRCFEQALAAIITAQHLYQLQVVHFEEETEDMFTSSFGDQLELNNHIFTEINNVANKLELLLIPHLLALGISSLPSLRSSEERLPNNSTPLLDTPTMMTTETPPPPPPPPSTNTDNGVVGVLQQFHTACQFSYLATSSDLLIRVIHAQITVQSIHLEDKTTPGHASLVSMMDLCTRLRTELVGTGLVGPLSSSEQNNGPVSLVLSRNSQRTMTSHPGVMEGIEADDRQQIAYGLSRTILQSLIACFTNLSHVVASSMVNRDEGTMMQHILPITVSPAQLRICLSDIGKVKDCLVTTNIGTSTTATTTTTTTTNTENDANPFRLKMVHYACKGEEDVLWHLLLDHPSMSSHTSYSHNNHNDNYSQNLSNISGVDNGHRDQCRSDWMALAGWHERAKEYHNQLVEWEQVTDPPCHCMVVDITPLDTPCWCLTTNRCLTPLVSVYNYVPLSYSTIHHPIPLMG